MQELTFEEQQESANIQAKAFISDPRHTRYVESDANNAVLVEAIGAAGLEWNAENLHRVFTENLNRLELKPDPNAQPTGAIREGDIDFNVLRARQAVEEQRKANDALLAAEERARQAAANQDEGDKVPFGYDAGRWTGLAVQQAARRQQSAPVQFRNGRPVSTSVSLPTSQNREALVKAGELHAAELRRQAATTKRHL